MMHGGGRGSGRHLRPIWLIFCSLVLASKIDVAKSSATISNLIVVPSFHSVDISWDSAAIRGHGLRRPRKFRVTLCESQPWGLLINCRTNEVVEQTTASTGSLSSKQKTTFSGLQMATSYTVQVRSSDDAENNSGVKNENEAEELEEGIAIVPEREDAPVISVDTKGFKALATTCHPDRTQILVETGPFFGGLISLEAEESEEAEAEAAGGRVRCDLKGDSSSPRTQYLFTILHDTCLGVYQNKTVITATVVVQESWPLMTSSTRRFMLACNLKPSAFTLKAGINMPRAREFSTVDAPDNKLVLGGNVPEWSLVGDGVAQTVNQKLMASVNFEKDSIRVAVPTATTVNFAHRQGEINYEQTEAKTSRHDVGAKEKGDLHTQTVAASKTQPRGSDGLAAKSSPSTEFTSVNEQPFQQFPTSQRQVVPSEGFFDKSRASQESSMMPSNNQAEDVVASKLTSTSENDVELRELQSSHQQMDRESRTASEYNWYTLPEDEPYPVSHIVLMVVLVVSAFVGTIATLAWINSLIQERRKQRRLKRLWPERSNSMSESRGTSTSDGTYDDLNIILPPEEHQYENIPFPDELSLNTRPRCLQTWTDEEEPHSSYV